MEISLKALIASILLVFISSGLGLYAGFSYAQLQSRLDYEHQLVDLQDAINELNLVNTELNNQLNLSKTEIEELSVRVAQLEEKIPTPPAFEKVEITTAYASLGIGQWIVTLNLKNTGTTTATITDVFVNAKSYKNYGTGNILVYVGSTGDTALPSSGYSIVSGSSGKVVVVIDRTPNPGSSYSWTSGTTIEVSLRTAAGNTYMKMVTLP